MSNCCDLSSLLIHVLSISNIRSATEMQVKGFSGARYQGNESKQEALDAWEHSIATNTVGPILEPSISSDYRQPTIPLSLSRLTSRPLAAAGPSQPMSSPSPNVPRTPFRSPLLAQKAQKASPSRALFNPLSFHYVVLWGSFPGVYVGR